MFGRGIKSGICAVFALFVSVQGTQASEYSAAVQAAIAETFGSLEVRNVQPTALNYTPSGVPALRWHKKEGSDAWTLAALEALRSHGRVLGDMTPRDIDTWCPAYRTATRENRDLFWAGLVSAITLHESTYRERVEGGGGENIGLMQINPTTARHFNCEAQSTRALKDGGRNVSCAIRIMSHTVQRDGVVSEDWKGVAKDWGPFHVKTKRHDMIDYMNAQPYCQASAQMRALPLSDQVSGIEVTSGQRAQVGHTMEAVLFHLEQGNKSFGQ